jgi:hypothetical protein
MRCLFGFLCVCALGVVPMAGCSETAGTGGTGGGGVGGVGGDGGSGGGGTGGSAGDGGSGGSGGTPDCSVCNGFPVCECTYPLTDYPCHWVGAFCGTYDETVAVAVDWPWICDQWWFGLCGGYRCLHHEYIVQQTLFYDSSGALIAVYMCGDYGCYYCGGTTMCERYGPVPLEGDGVSRPSYEIEWFGDLCESPPPQ